MRRDWLLPLALVALLAPSLLGAGQAEAPSAGDQRAIRNVIEAQLEAFQRDDGGTAFSYASPGIRQRFATPENFMAMVRGGYGAVYRPREVEFLETLAEGGRTAQAVRFVGPDSKAVMAIYTMERQSDGSWLIDGVYLVELAEVGS